MFTILSKIRPREQIEKEKIQSCWGEVLKIFRRYATAAPLIINNIAFNARVVPSAKDTYEQTVDRMMDYAQTYFEKGRMQVQFNVVDTDTLKDAMVNPEHYADLLVSHIRLLRLLCPTAARPVAGTYPPQRVRIVKNKIPGQGHLLSSESSRII